MLRAVEIHFGSPPLIEHFDSDKETTIALKEIAQGRVTLKSNGSKQKIKKETTDEDVQ